MRVKDPSVFELAGRRALPCTPREVIARLAPMMTPERRLRIEEVAAKRTLGIALVLEEVEDPHNTSAVLRSADAFGVHRVHYIARSDAFLATRKVAKGSERWLDLVEHDDASTCIAALREERRAIFVAAMDGEHRPEELARHERVAVVFGNEQDGASSAIRDAADGTFAIPMLGFVESLNVSVAAAVTLYALSTRMPCTASAEERLEITARMMMATVKDAELLLGITNATE